VIKDFVEADEEEDGAELDIEAVALIEVDGMTLEFEVGMKLERELMCGPRLIFVFSFIFKYSMYSFSCAN
jgi:hypothetical protein